jgi:hypothetical protein
VTLENFADTGTDAWQYQMYGPPTKEGQTFHEQQTKRIHEDDDKSTKPEYGQQPTTIRVRGDGR